MFGPLRVGCFWGLNHQAFWFALKDKLGVSFDFGCFLVDFRCYCWVCLMVLLFCVFVDCGVLA